MDQHATFMQQAIKLAKQNIQHGGGPFGALIVKNNTIIGSGANQVTQYNDPTAHAEIVAIRAACKSLHTFSLEGCAIYSSCEPCPMCLSAIYWAKISKLYFGATHEDARKAGFRDDFIYKELALPIDKRTLHTEQLQREEALSPFNLWEKAAIKTLY